MQVPTPPSFAARLEHTMLRADACEQDIEVLCEQALSHGLYGVCVNGVHVARCAALLRATPCKLVTVVGFPLGAMTSKSKAFEAEEAIANGADEIDMVLQIGALRAGEDALVQRDIECVVRAVQPHTLKVILETSALDDAQKRAGCRLARDAGAHFVKTSTGFGAGGARVADIELMRAAVGRAMQIKASGGIRSRAAADALIAAGADRLGVSASIALLHGDHTL